MQEERVEHTSSGVVVNGWPGTGLLVPQQVGWANPCRRGSGAVPAPAGSRRHGHHARTAQALSLPGKHSTFAVFLMQFFSQRLYMRALTSFVTVVALNRKWLIFHDYFSVRHDFGENASVWLAWENEPASLSFQSKCSQALHAIIPILDENSLAVWLMLCCKYVSTKVNTYVLETSVSLVSLAS